MARSRSGDLDLGLLQLLISDLRGDDRALDVVALRQFDRVAGGKPFDTSQVWFTDLLRAIGMTS